jgi:hypothetical protein
MKNLNTPEINEILSLRISNFIYELPDTQIDFEPFSNLSLNEDEINRAKFCLYVFNLTYAYYIINLCFVHHQEFIKPLLDTIHKKFRDKLDSSYSNNWFTFNNIILLEDEKKYIIQKLRTLGIDFDEKTKTSLIDIFDFIYDKRHPVYYSGILKAKKQGEVQNPFYQLSLSFTHHFLGKQESKFAYEFSIYTNIRTMNILFDFISKNIEDLYE